MLKCSGIPSESLGPGQVLCSLVDSLKLVIMADKRCGNKRHSRRSKKGTCLWDCFTVVAKDKIKFIAPFCLTHCSTHNKCTIVGSSNACKVVYSMFLKLPLHGFSDESKESLIHQHTAHTFQVASNDDPLLHPPLSRVSHFNFRNEV